MYENRFQRIKSKGSSCFTYLVEIDLRVHFKLFRNARKKNKISKFLQSCQKKCIELKF